MMRPVSGTERMMKSSGMMLFARPFLAGLCLWITAWMGAVAAAGAEVSCENWNTKAFFERASVADVSRCLKVKDPNARGRFKLTRLHVAARNSKTAAVITVLVKAGAEVNARDDWEETPLHEAARNKNPAVAATLLKAGADPKALDKSGETSLDEAFLGWNLAVAALLKASVGTGAREQYGDTPLHWAAWNKKPAVIAALLKGGADPNARDKYGRTSLHWATLNKNRVVMAALLRAGAEVNARDKRENTPLHRAAGSNENPAIVAALMKAGAEMNARDDWEETPLHKAARNKNPAVAATLLKAGAEVNARDKWENTPLHRAAEFNENPAIVTALVAAGADPNARDVSGETPLQMAKERENPAIVAAFGEKAVAAFREKKAAAAARKQQIQRRLWAALVSCEKWNSSGFFRHADAAAVSRCLKTKDPNVRDEKGRTALHLAAQHSKTPAVVAPLAKAGADLNARDEKGRTPLHLAAVFSKAPAIVAALAKAGADLNALDEKGRTPLQFAEKFSKTRAIVKALKKAQAKPGSRPGVKTGVSCEKWNTPAFFKHAGAADLSRCLETKDANARNKDGRTPLHYAAQGKAPVIVAALAKAGAKVNARDEKGGWTPLHLAAWFGKTPAVVRALLDAGADPAVKDQAGKTPRDYARENAALKGADLSLRRAGVSCGDWNTASFFERAGPADVSRCLKTGAKVIARDETGRTPLHTAAFKSETPAVVAALAKAGARVNARDERGWTPLHYAAQGEAPAVVAALAKAGAKVNARDETGATPLHTAAEKSATPAVVAALLAAGADPAVRDQGDKTPWDHAKANPALKGTDLYQRLAGVSCGDWNTKAFFEHARAADVSRCLKAGAKVNARDGEGRTPLHLAAVRSEAPDVVTALLAAGADPAGRDKTGKTPWDYAKASAALKGTEVYWQLNEGRFK